LGKGSKGGYFCTAINDIIFGSSVMKTFLFLLLCGMTFCLPFKNKTVSTGEAIGIAANAPAEPAADTVIFSAQILPMLQDRCSPCHFPGGKMYEKMPFDQPKTLLEHSEGILKRFKDESENRLLKQFVETARG